MKNLSIYITPLKRYTQEAETSIRIWIDNSLDLGWKKEDILFVNNFPYQYNGIKSIVVDEDSFCPFRPGSTKTCTVADLLEREFMKDGEIYWVHDPDAYQMNIITEKELELDKVDVGFTTYGWSPKWCLGSYFLKNSAKDIFQWIKNTVYEYFTEDERALVHLTKNNFNNINDRIKTLNITYNFGQRNIPINYELATKPIKVVHFRPKYFQFDNIGQFMYGKNELGIPIMNERLIRIFHKHGLK